MAVLTQEPPRPAIHSSPPPTLILRNIHFKEWMGVISAGAVTYFIGSFHKQPRAFRKLNRYAFGISGILGYEFKQDISIL